MRERANEALSLLYWIKQNFINKKLYTKREVVAEVPVWLGVKDKVKLLITEDASILIPSPEQDTVALKTELKKEVPSYISAPLKAGDVVGRVLITSGNDIYEMPLVTEEDIEKVGIFKQIIRYISYLLGKK